MACPHCHQNAPIVYKGMLALCTACKQPRTPFSGKALNFAGQPSRLGGRLGRAFGYLVLIFGLLLAAALILFFQLLWPAASIGYALGLPIALISIVLSALFLLTSRRLGRSGADAQRAARVEALYALSAYRGGMLTAADAARSLELDVTQIDALLSDLARTDSDHVALEFDSEGQTFYLFSPQGPEPQRFGAKYRVSGDGRVRVTNTLDADRPDDALEGDALDAGRAPGRPRQ